MKFKLTPIIQEDSRIEWHLHFIAPDDYCSSSISVANLHKSSLEDLPKRFKNNKMHKLKINAYHEIEFEMEDRLGADYYAIWVIAQTLEIIRRDNNARTYSEDQVMHYIDIITPIESLQYINITQLNPAEWLNRVILKHLSNCIDIAKEEQNPLIKYFGIGFYNIMLDNDPKDILLQIGTPDLSWCHETFIDITRHYIQRIISPHSVIQLCRWM
jgi:hypothetical protein